MAWGEVSEQRTEGYRKPRKRAVSDSPLPIPILTQVFPFRVYGLYQFNLLFSKPALELFLSCNCIANVVIYFNVNKPR